MRPINALFFILSSRKYFLEDTFIIMVQPFSFALFSIKTTSYTRLTPRRADSHFSDPWSLKWSCTFSFLLILIWLYYFCGMFHIHDIHFFDALQSTKTISQAQEDHFSTKSHLEIYVFLLAFFNDHQSDHHVLGRV